MHVGRAYRVCNRLSISLKPRKAYRINFAYRIQTCSVRGMTTIANKYATELQVQQMESKHMPNKFKSNYKSQNCGNINKKLEP